MKASSGLTLEDDTKGPLPDFLPDAVVGANDVVGRVGGVRVRHERGRRGVKERKGAKGCG